MIVAVFSGLSFVATTSSDDRHARDFLEPMVLPYYDRTSFPLTVDEGCLVVMGDNRNRSADSRYASIGQIEESQVIGKVLCILFPGCGESASRDFGRIGALDNG